MDLTDKQDEVFVKFCPVNIRAQRMAAIRR